MTALLRYQAAILLRSHRWIFPLIAYALLMAVGAAGSSSLAETLNWSGAMLVPVVAFLTRASHRAQYRTGVEPGGGQLAGAGPAGGGGLSGRGDLGGIRAGCATEGCLVGQC